MVNNELYKKSQEIFNSYLNNLGFELVELRIFWAQGLFNIRLLTDKPRGGISMDEVVNLNRQLRELLEKEDIFKEAFVLEVCSPGADRSLVSKRDFLKVYGRRLRVFLKEPLNLKIELEGVVEEASDDFLFLTVEGNTEKVPLNIINKGKQIIN